MAKWEKEALNKCPLKPKIFLRYLDDIFIIWQHGEESFLLEISLKSDDFQVNGETYLQIYGTAMGMNEYFISVTLHYRMKLEHYQTSCNATEVTHSLLAVYLCHPP